MRSVLLVGCLTAGLLSGAAAQDDPIRISIVDCQGPLFEAEDVRPPTGPAVGAVSHTLTDLGIEFLQQL